MELNFSQYIMLSLVNQISGKRGVGTIVGILRGSQRRSVVTLKNWKDSNLDVRYIGLMSGVPEANVKALYDFLLESRLLTFAEDKIGDFWYPLVHITNVGKEVLAEKSAKFSTKLEELLKANKALQDFQAELIPEKRKKDTLTETEKETRRGLPWSEEEDNDLKNEYATKKNIEELAKIFQRSPVSIYCRLRKLKLIEPDLSYEKLIPSRKTEKKNL
ncbi:MAG: RQC domain-containing protein [Elusimicrobiota bacterium]